MVSILVSLVCAGLVLFAQVAWAGEKLVYAVVYKGSNYAAVRTEIISLDPETAEKQLVFSDEKTSIVLVQNRYVFHFPVVGGASCLPMPPSGAGLFPFPATPQSTNYPPTAPTSSGGSALYWELNPSEISSSTPPVHASAISTG
jgi:hypothetical protein